MKRSLLVLFCLYILCVVFCASSAEIDEPVILTAGDYQYIVLSDGTAEIRNYSGTETNLLIPSQLDGTFVSSIGSRTFSWRVDLISVTIPDNVKNIGDEVFNYCTNLTNIKLPNGITRIGDKLFYHCYHLTDVTLPAGVTEIGNEAFSCCSNLVAITIPDGVTTIGNDVFFNCTTLTSVTLPDSLIKIGTNPFRLCRNLEKLWISPDHPALDMVDGVLFSKSRTERRLIFFPITKSESDNQSDRHYIIPQGTTVIGEGAFYSCGLISVVIPDTVTKIGTRAFALCYRLTDVTIPDSVTSLGDEAFDWCDLTSITIPNGVTRIGNRLFTGNKNLTNVTIPDSVTSIGDYAFYCNYSLSDIILPDSISSIGYRAFYECYSLVGLTIPYSVISIGDESFTGCNNLTLMVFSDSYAEQYCKSGGYSYVLTSQPETLTAGDYQYALLEDGTAKIQKYTGNGHELLIPSELNGIPVSSIGKEAFSACTTLTSITIPDGIVAIEEEAFTACDNLISVTIPGSVIEVGDNPFTFCSSLSSIIVSSDHPVLETVDGILFNKVDHRLICYPPTKAEKKYDIPKGTVIIGDAAFANCFNLFSVYIPDGVTRIGSYAFINCRFLLGVSIPDSVNDLGINPFIGCQLLSASEYPVIKTKDGVISSAVISPDHSALKIMDGSLVSKTAQRLIWYPLTKSNLIYTIPQGITIIGEVAFFNCSHLTNVTIPDGVISIEYGAFANCKNLNSVTVPDSISNIGDDAFAGCSDLTLSVVADSYAEQYCKENNLRYRLISRPTEMPATEKPKAEKTPVSHPTKLPANKTKSNHSTGSRNKDDNSLNIIFMLVLGVIFLFELLKALPKDDSSGIQKTRKIVKKPAPKKKPAPVPSENYLFTHLADGTVEIRQYSGSYVHLTIPSVIEDLPVSGIGNRAFFLRKNLASITIPDSVTTIGNSAFFGCSILRQIILPEHLASIGSMAFYDCGSLMSISLPPSVISIGRDAFDSCPNLTLIVSPGSYAEWYCRENRLPYVYPDSPSVSNP